MKQIRKAIVMVIAVAMLVTGSGISSFATATGDQQVSTQAAQEVNAENPEKAEKPDSDAEADTEKEEAEADHEKEAADQKALSEEKDESAEQAEKVEKGGTEQESAEEKSDSQEKPDRKADVEKQTDWMKTLPLEILSQAWWKKYSLMREKNFALDAELLRDTILAVAKSQLGYKESIRNYKEKNGVRRAYTRYGAFMGEEYVAPWDAAFVLFSLYYAGAVDVKAAHPSIPVDTDTTKWLLALNKARLTKQKDEYIPKPGDIVFAKEGEQAADGSPTQIVPKAAIVTDVNASILTVIQSDKVHGRNLVASQQWQMDDVLVYVPVEKLAKAMRSQGQKKMEEPAAADAADQDTAASGEKNESKREGAAPADRTAALNLQEQKVDAEKVEAPGEKKNTASSKLGYLFNSQVPIKDDTEITVSGQLPKGAVVKAYPVDVRVPGQNVLVAYDITIYEPQKDGSLKEWQPEEEALTVSFEGDKLDNASGQVNIYHMQDQKAAPEFVEDTGVKDSKVDFHADSFSIYVVTSELTRTYTFMNGEDVFSKQVLEDGKTLVEPASPVRKGAVFKHWSADEEGDTPYDGFNKTVSVSEATDNGEVKLYAVFEEQKHCITYHDQNGGIVETQMVGVGKTVDTDAVDYTPIQNQEGVHLQFLHWTKDASGKGSKVGSFQPTEDVDLYPVVRAGHWIYFDVNKQAIQNGDASYPAPEFVVPGEANKPGTDKKPVSVSSCSGYSFEGWYTRKSGGAQVFDKDGKRVEEGYAKITKDGELFSEPTLYAHWSKGTAKYQVVYYVQKASDEVGLADDEKSYEIYKLGDVRTVAAGTTVTADPDKDAVKNVFAAPEGASTEEKNQAKQDIHGFVLSENTSPVKVRSDGVTELQVKYDRKPFTLVFRNYANGSSLDNGSLIVVADSDTSKAGTPSNSAKKGDYYWNRGTDAKQVTALYGHDISGEFPVEVSYRVCVDSFQPGGLLGIGRKDAVWSDWESDNDLTAWRDANQQSAASCGIKNLFRVLYRMPSLYDENGTDYSEKILIHNERETTDKVLYYYREVVPGSYSGVYSDTLGSDHIRRTINGEQRDYERVYTMKHLYKRQSNNFTKDALFQDMNGYNNYSGYCEPQDLFTSTEEIPNKSAVFYTLKEYKITLVDPTGIKDNVVKVFKFKSKISENDLPKFNYSEDQHIERRSDVDYWYLDKNGAAPVDFKSFEMPNHDITLYAGVKKQYIVQIDPAGGELFGKDGSENNYSTWYRADAGTKAVEYGNITRDYVKANDGEGTHKYVEYKYDPSDKSKPRTATYVKDANQAEYKYEKGAYTLTGWVQVKEDGTETQYNFDNPINSNLKLKAKWRRNANFRIVYNSASDEIKAPVDQGRYEDNSHAIALEALDAPEGKRFVGWKDKKGNVYKPNQLIAVNETVADVESDHHMVITLTAQYENYSPQSNIMADYTFMNGTDTYYVQTISAGETLIAPKPPVKDGYVFSGWYRDSACTKRFDGFGTIKNPVYTTLYAGFKKGHTVTYFTEKNGDKGDSVITTQTYADGAKLNTNGVEYTGVKGKVVTGWTDQQGVKYDYESSTDVPVKKDMELWPVVETLDVLYFDSNGGSFVPSETVPLDRRPATPKEPVRDGFKFSGWFTDKACSEGKEYDFSTTLPDNVETLYAKWEADEENPAEGELTVLVWAQTPDRPESDEAAAADKKHYELANSFSFTKGYKEYTLAEVTKMLADQGVAISDPLILKDVRSRYSKSTDEQFRKYFAYNASKTDASVNVNKPDDNVLNVYFDREKYKIAFDIGSYGWIYDKNTKRFVNGKDYVIDAWLDRPVVDEWPILSKERENSTEKEQSYINWKASKSFNSWSPAKGSGVSAAAATTQLVTDYEMINGAVNGNGTLVYTATTTGQYQTVKAVAHYILEGKEAFSQDLMILEDHEYNDVGSVYKKVDGVNVYTRLLAKEIEGYRNVTEATPSGYNPEEMAVYEGSNPVNLYFFYKKKGYNLKLMETDAKEFKKSQVPYATKLTGEDGYLETEKSIGIPTAPKAGVEFDCWSTTPSASAPYTANDGKMPAYDITLYARWKPIQVSIRTEVDGVITEYPARDYNTTLEEYEIPDPVKEGMAFVGWYDESTKTYVGPKDNIKRSMVLKAVFRDASGVQIKYDSNNGNGDVPVDEKKYSVGANAVVKSGSGLTKTLKDIDGKDYDAGFVCWNTSADGKGSIYYPGSQIEVSGETTLYAIYSSKRQADLIYNKHGENAEFVAKDGHTGLATMKGDDLRVLFRDYMDIKSMVDPIKYPNTKVTIGHDNNDKEFFVRRPGYTFSGWSTDASASKGTIRQGATAYVNTLGSGNTLYAIWQEDTLPIEVYQYLDDEIDKATLVQGSDGKYHQTTVDQAGKSIAEIENAYKSGKEYTIDDGYVFHHAVISDDSKTAEADQLEYVLNEEGTGYVWKYHIVGTEADAFLSLSGAKLKIYYQKTTKVPLTIREEIAGKYADMTKEFEYTLSIEGAKAGDEFDYEKGSVSGKIKSGDKFQLRHGEAIKIIVPKNKAVTVTETPIDGFTPAFTSEDQNVKPDSEEIANGIKVRVVGNGGALKVTNTYSDVVPTGVGPARVLVLPVLLLLILAYFVSVRFVRRRAR